MVPLKVNLSLPLAGGLVRSSSCFLEKESMLLKPFPESTSLMDIVVDWYTTVIIVVRVEVKDIFKFNLELNWGGEFTERTLKSPLLLPSTFGPHSMDVCLLWFPHCEKAVYKYRSIFSLRTELFCFSQSIFVHQNRQSSSLYLQELEDGCRTRFLSEKSKWCWARDVLQSTPLGIAINECGSTDRRAASWQPTLNNSLFLADCGNLMFIWNLSSFEMQVHFKNLKREIHCEKMGKYQEIGQQKSTFCRRNWNPKSIC